MQNDKMECKNREKMWTEKIEKVKRESRINRESKVRKLIIVE